MELRQALLALPRNLNETWLIERHGFLSPAEYRQRQLQPLARAAARLRSGACKNQGGTRSQYEGKAMAPTSPPIIAPLSRRSSSGDYAELRALLVFREWRTSGDDCRRQSGRRPLCDRAAIHQRYAVADANRPDGQPCQRMPP